MSEYQPQWTRTEKTAIPAQDGTDRTDSFKVQGQTVSSVSAALGAESRNRAAQTSPAGSGGLYGAAALGAQLEAGWRWLASHPNHPEHVPFLTRWLERLREYERTYAAVHSMEMMDPCLS